MDQHINAQVVSSPSPTGGQEDNDRSEALQASSLGLTEIPQSREIQIGVLGPVYVSIDGDEIKLPPIQRNILGILATGRSRCSSIEYVIEHLWNRSVLPERTTKVLRGHVSLLRKSLGSGVILTTQTGYSLAAKLAVDIWQFTELLKTAEKHAAHGNWLEVQQLCTKAKELWRGEPLEGETTELSSGCSAVLLSRRDRVGDLLVSSLLRTQQFPQAIQEAEAVLAADPLREHVGVQLMTALQATGRNSEALFVYGRIRRSLAESLGIEPGLALKQAELDVLTKKQ